MKNNLRESDKLAITLLDYILLLLAVALFPPALLTRWLLNKDFGEKQHYAEKRRVDL